MVGGCVLKHANVVDAVRISIILRQIILFQEVDFEEKSAEAQTVTKQTSMDTTIFTDNLAASET